MANKQLTNKEALDMLMDIKEKINEYKKPEK